MTFLKKISGVMIIFAAFILILYFNRIPEQISDECGITMDDIKKINPDAASFEIENSNCFFSVTNGSGERIGKVIALKNDETDPAGYGGRLRIIAGIDNDNRINGIEIGQNTETPGFIEMIRNAGFFNNWNGLSPQDAINKKVDTITGATMSTSAVISMVRKNISLYSGLKKETEKRESLPIVFFVSIMVILYSVFAFFFPKKTIKYRYIQLAVLVVLLGFAGGYSISMETVKNALVNRHFSLLTIIIFSLSAILSMIKGKNFYCTQLCPFGAFQELAGKVPVKKFTVPCRVFKYMKIFRKLFLFTLFGLMLFNVVSDFTIFEPFSAFQFRGAGTFSLIIAALSLTVSFFICRPWCRLLCPTGELFDIIKVSGKEHKKENCR
jgi:NosR/NirI family transcriptional regulator, nitrous oxide reductase regulator